jgi:hypothetical protein
VKVGKVELLLPLFVAIISRELVQIQPPRCVALQPLRISAALPLRTHTSAPCRAPPQRLHSPTLRGAARPQADDDDLIDLIRRARRRCSLPNLHNILSMARCLSP